MLVFENNSEIKALYLINPMIGLGGGKIFKLHTHSYSEDHVSFCCHYLEKRSLSNHED